MGRISKMEYPHGWVEDYHYDSIGQLLKVEDTHPSEKPAKTQKHTYAYDANGNMTYEYMRGNGTGQAKNETLYTYDALNRLITAHDNYGNSTRTYTYDSLGNLTYETGGGSHNCDYIYNNLNQQIDRSSDNWNSHTTSAYDKRGNLILEEYIKNSKVTTAGAYTYDETNKMVRGVNGNAEESIYTYNGLGALMEQTWIIAKNGYGYHDVSATAVVDGEVVVDSVTGKRQQKVRLTPEELEAANAAAEAAEAASAETGITETSADANTLTATLVTYGNAANGNNGNSGNGNGTQDKPTGSDVKKTSTVVKQFVVDFSSETYKPLMEHEVNGLDYRYVYSDKARLSVVVQGIENGSASLLDDAGELHAYYHCDYLGTTDYLTSAVNSKVIAWTSYNEWGEITHNAVLKCGQRELDLVKEYATHDYDAVLDLYYAKARFYDAYNRHFVSADLLKGTVENPMTINQYIYVLDNPLKYVDEYGLMPYGALNLLGYGLAKNTVPHEIAFATVVVANGNPSLAGHQLAQAFAYKWLYQNYGYYMIDLEVTIPSSNTRIDVVARKGNEITLFELKSLTNPYDDAKKDYKRGNTIAKKASKQLATYYSSLKCDINPWYALATQGKVNLSGSISYKLFDVANTSWYINLKHFPEGVIEYWFSYKTQRGSKQPQTFALPASAKSAYKSYAPLRLAEQRIYAALKGYNANTVFLITTGVVVAGVVTGVTIAAVGPEVAAWVASGATNIQIAVSSAVTAGSQIIYQAGQVIEKAIQTAPTIPNLLGT